MNLKDRGGDVIICNVFLGDIEFVSAQAFLKAAERYKKAIKLYTRDSVAMAFFKVSVPTLSAIHIKLGNSLARLSKVNDAIAQYKAGFQESRRPKDELSAHMSLGNLYFSIRKYNDALEEYEKSSELAAAHINNPRYLGKIHENITHTCLKLHRNMEAIDHFRKSFQFVSEHERGSRDLYRTYNNFGSTYESMNDLIMAEKFYNLALRHAEDVSSQIRIYDKISNVLLTRGQYEEAITHCTEMLHLCSDTKATIMVRLNRGYAYLKLALQTIQPDNPFETKIHGLQCDVDNCLSKVPTSTKKLCSLGSHDLKIVMEHYEWEIQKKNDFVSFTTKFQLACSCLQDCHIILHDLEAALVVAERCRARVLGEQMLERGCLNRKSYITSPLSFSHIRKIIKECQNPVVYLSYTGNHIICWVFISQSGQVLMNSFKIPVSVIDLFGGKAFDYFLTDDLTHHLMHAGDHVYQNIPHNNVLSRQLQVLFDLMGRPLLEILSNFEKKTRSNVKKLVLISDKYTSLVPFSCLYDQTSESFFTDKYSFQRVPSFLTLDIMIHRPVTSVKIPADASNMYVIGNPDVPHAKEEVEWVANTLQTTPSLEHETMLSLQLNLVSAKVIHIATKGCVEDGTLAIPSSGEGNVNDVFIHPRNIQRLKMLAAFVVFVNSGEFVTTSIKASKIEAMCQAFIQAGAQAVLTSLWQVPSKSAAIFIQFFYQYLLDGLQGSLAVQRAILSVRCFPEFSQYIHWSGYQLTGQDVSLLLEETPHIRDLKTSMGSASVFPRWQEIQKLKQNLILEDQNRVQVCAVINYWLSTYSLH